ncbi:MAG: GatB/YqeY [Candidatus Moraniibacteriota bacterium]|nr:MAG: GatB/YqeY [Candidatus Moranbacteria bacterium]
MLLRKQIVEDLKVAMKSGDVAARDTLRSLDSMIKNEEIAQNKREEGLGDVETVSLVKRAIKQRKDSAQQYRDGDREELAQKEEEEIAVIEKYLPEQMSEKEVRSIVEKVIAEVGAEKKSDIGQVMGKVMSEVGESADGNTVRAIVEELLG